MNVPRMLPEIPCQLFNGHVLVCQVLWSSRPHDTRYASNAGRTSRSSRSGAASRASHLVRSGHTSRAGHSGHARAASRAGRPCRASWSWVSHRSVTPCDPRQAEAAGRSCVCFVRERNDPVDQLLVNPTRVILVPDWPLHHTLTHPRRKAMCRLPGLGSDQVCLWPHATLA